MFKNNKINTIISHNSTNNLIKNDNELLTTDSLYKLIADNREDELSRSDYENNTNNVGYTRHYPPTIRVWNNSVYNYNKNSQDNSLVKYNKLNKLIKSYFNLHNNKNLARSKRMRYQRIKSISKKLYLSRPEVKQTNDKISITVYYFDKLKHRYIRKIFYFNKPSMLKYIFKKRKKNLFIRKIKFLEKRIKYSGMREIKNSKLFKDKNKYKNKYIEQFIWLYFFKYLFSLINIQIYNPISVYNVYINEKNKIKYINSIIKKESMIIDNIIKSNPKIIFWIDYKNYCFEKIENKNINYLYLMSKVIKYHNITTTNNNNYITKLNFVSQINKKLSEIVNMFVITNIISKSLLLKAYNYITLKAYKGFSTKMYKKRYNKISKLTVLSMTNIIKFKNLLPSIKMAIDIFYNKKTELNMVNLKYFYLNSDIYTQAIVTKLKKKVSPKKIINKSLGKVKVFYNYNTKKQVILNNLNKLFAYTKISIDSFPVTFLHSNLKHISTELNLDNIQKILKKIFPQNLLYKYHRMKRIFSNKTSNILNTVKYKGILGIRMEANGRLTRRHKAARSVSHLVYKGNLKDSDLYFYEKENRDESIPTVILRNDVRANTQFTYKSSFRRIGSFGIKTWISGK